ncbi:Hypothetical protein GbCGDNIH4_7200 [Granulibacter bethesdensis CGDNIH4]|nr:Hypothetical protein GbCGDNIH4_7200 [Granulibacter bethesdensis CGDNIH4]
MAWPPRQPDKSASDPAKGGRLINWTDTPSTVLLIQPHPGGLHVHRNTRRSRVDRGRGNRRHFPSLVRPAGGAARRRYSERTGGHAAIAGCQGHFDAGLVEYAAAGDHGRRPISSRPHLFSTSSRRSDPLRAVSISIMACFAARGLEQRRHSAGMAAGFEKFPESKRAYGLGVYCGKLQHTHLRQLGTIEKNRRHPKAGMDRIFHRSMRCALDCRYFRIGAGGEPLVSAGRIGGRGVGAGAGGGAFAIESSMGVGISMVAGRQGGAQAHPLTILGSQAVTP